MGVDYVANPSCADVANLSQGIFMFGYNESNSSVIGK